MRLIAHPLADLPGAAIDLRPCVPRLDAVFFFQAEDGIRGADVTGVQTCALPISGRRSGSWRRTYVLSHFGQLPPGAARNRFAARRRVCSGVSRITRFMGREPLYTGNAPGWSAGGLLPSARLRVQERLACVRQPAQERGRLPDVAVPVLHVQHAGLDRLEPHLVRPEHRATPVDRPAVAVDPDHVDVARADRELLLEDLRSLVHHRIEQALEDLLVRDRPALD